MKLSPSSGGCWFCEQDDEQEILFFEYEWDTNIHISCLKNALEKDPEDPEAGLMKYMLETT